MFVQFSAFAMWTRLFLIPLLAVIGSVESPGLGDRPGSVDRPGSETVTVFAGETAVLPCRTHNSHDQLTVEWFKQDLDPDIVLAYRQGYEIHADKNLAYEFRTSLFMNELKNGNISLRIGSVQPSDGGTYYCRTIGIQEQTDHLVDLIVDSVSVSEPRLSVVHAEGAAVTVQCESGCWFPKPRMRLLDDGGNALSGVDLNPDQDPSRCFNITQRARLEDAVRRVTCRIELPGRDQTRVTEMYLQDGGGGVASCMVSTCIAVVEGVILLGLILCLVWVLMKSSSSRRLKHGISTDQSSMERNQDHDLLLRDELQGTVENLKNRLHTKEEENKQLTQQLHELESRLNQHSPDPVSSLQKRDSAPRLRPQTTSRISSCPDLCDDDNPPPSVSRSKSFSLSQPSQKVKSKRRYTTSGMFVLPEEDVERLLPHPEQPDPVH